MPDPFSIGPNTLSNDDVEVTRNNDDELVIVDKSSGEQVSIGPDGLSTGSLHTEGLNTNTISGQSPRQYTDTFNTYSRDEWTVVSEPVSWSTSDGRLVLGDGGVATHNAGGLGSGTYTATIDPNASNIGLIWGVQSNGSFYHARLSENSDAVQLYLFDGGSASSIASEAVTINGGTEYDLTVSWDADTGDIEVYVDDDEMASSPLISEQDTTHSAGEMGLRSYAGEGYVSSVSYTLDEMEETTTIDDGFSTPTTSTGELLSTEGESGGVSLHSALTQGFVIGFSEGKRAKVADPRNFSTDDGCIQAVNDYLVNTSPEGGDIHLPHMRPDGTPYIIENTVTLGDIADTVQVNIYFHGESYGNETAIQTTINDGSHMFLVTGDEQGTATVRGHTWRGGRFDLNDNDVGVAQFQYVTNADVALEWVQNFRGECFLFGSRCFESIMRRVRFKPDDENQTSPTAKCLVYRNTHDDIHGPNQSYIGPAVNSDGSHDISVLVEQGVAGLRISGKFEGMYGQAAIVSRSSTVIHVTQDCYVSATNGTDTHGIYFDGYKANIEPSRCLRINGHGIYINSGTSVYVSDYTDFETIEGDSIYYEADDNSRRVRLPHESVVEGSVTYPPAPWRGTRYLDGWQIFREGTDTITAGTKQRVENFGGSTGEQLSATVAVANQPASEVGIDWHTGFDPGSGQSTLHIEETIGDADVDISWKLLLRSDP